MNPFRQSVRVIGIYIRAQVLITGLVTLLYMAGWASASVPLWLPLGILSGLLDLVPGLGALVALGVVELDCFASDTHDRARLLWVLAIWVVIQGVENFIIQPRFLGRPLGLSAIAVFVALIAGSFLLGPIGFFVAVPLLAIAGVFWRHFRKKPEP